MKLTGFFITALNSKYTHQLGDVTATSEQSLVVRWRLLTFDNVIPFLAPVVTSA